MDKDIIAQNNQVAVPKYNNLNTGFQSALKMVDDIVLKNYITKLKNFDIVPLDEHTKKMNLQENVRLFKITEMVYEKDEFSTYKFASVFNSLSTTNCATFIIIDSNGMKTDFYMGIRSLDSERTTSSLRDTLKNAMTGQFPGIKTKEYLEDDMNSLLNKSRANNISIVSSVANSKDGENRTNEGFIQGLEKLALSMQGETYTGIIIANGARQDQLTEIRKGYENIYTQLSPFAKTQINYAYNSSINLSSAQSIGNSYSTNFSTTEGYSKTDSTGTSYSTTKNNASSKIASGVGSAAAFLGAALAPVTGGASIFVGGAVAMGAGLMGTAMQKSETQGTTTNTSYAENSSVNKGSTDTKTTNNTDTKGLTQGDSQSLTLNLEDKMIINTLDRLDKQLQRLNEFESLGMWECAAYFLSEKPYAAEIAASTYKSLMRGENSGVEVSAINSWHSYDKQEVPLLKEYALNMMHPVFKYKDDLQNIEVTPATLVSGNELAIHMGLPRKSVCGFPVIEHADFGKEVVSYYNTENYDNINLGKVFNMGSECNNQVKLDRNSLSMHTFVTGSTGSGKSNTIYEMLRQLSNIGVNFLVVEPTKGEYKNVFGNRPDVKVYGTNPKVTPLLRINPFRFPKGVHVLEHIDRLVEIFNVCWPMYAAMPAVLKEAVLQSYEVCGWDLTQSVNIINDDLFPNFYDLLCELENVIENSAYDKEVKSNYKGSLETRVRSLTNGLNGQIFTNNEIDNNLLFDSNVIVDLSRVGSLETKSLIMGILIMRLNEHRMVFAEEMNQPLKHITVLEEAHNILKRTSTEQLSEGSNMVGKSVEMLSNAIAEMRTYGEGFIIADQSPSAVDHSAIRNTNTKIIMRLPDEDDRRVSGKSAALKDEQLDEIAKLPKGVAVVYQNDWIEPVLCKISKYPHEIKNYTYSEILSEKTMNFDEKTFNYELLKLLVKPLVNEKVDFDILKLKEGLSYSSLSTKYKILVISMITEYESADKLSIWESSQFEKLSVLLSELFGFKNKTNQFLLRAANIEQLNFMMKDLICEKMCEPTDEICLALSQCLMKKASMESAENLELYKFWIDSVSKRGGLI